MTATHERKLRSITLMLVILVCAGEAFSQFNLVDPSFQPVPSSTASAVTKSQILQPDGKVIVWGGNRVVRLNSNGTLDSSFQYCACHLSLVSSVVLQADGKMIVAGTGLDSKAKVVRLNPDGARDNSYVAQLPPTPTSTSTSYVWLVQSDGKSYVQLDEPGGFSGTRRIFRLNTDGSLDNGFTTIELAYNQTSMVDFVLQASKLYAAYDYVAISSSFGEIKRFNLDGMVDSTWQSPTFAGKNGSFFSYLSGIAFQPDGSLLVSGSFGSVNGFQKSDLARVLPAGNVDLAFTPPTVSEGGRVKVLASGKLLWNVVQSGGTFYRLNSNGSIDPTFVDSLSNIQRDTRWVLDSMERIYYYGSDNRFHRLNPNGDADPSFAPDVPDFGKVYAVARQSDGRIVIAGIFTRMNGVPRTSVARVYADGTLDTSFDAGTGFDMPPTQMLAQPDGKILAIGPFTTYNGSAASGILRINNNGTRDSGFVTTVANVKAMALQSDGKILIGGSFTTVNGVTRNYFARLLGTGDLDSSLTTVVGCCDVNDLLIQPDGKIVIAGGFSGVDGFIRPNLARLTSEGVLDQTLTATPTTGSNLITKLAIQPSGKYLTAINNSGIRRRNTDGSLDDTFPFATFSVTGSPRINSIFVDTDGSFLVGGYFSQVNNVARANFVRLSADGVLDPFFVPTGTDAEVRSIIGAGGSKVIIGGEFARVNDSVRAGIARLSLRRASEFDFDGDGRGDISVFRSSTNRWYEVVSSTGQVYQEDFGIAGDVLAPADFDGDGVTDEAIFRPSNGQWWYHSSANGGLVLNPFGGPGDIPRPSDFDGDGKADLVIFRPSNNTWFRYSSATNQEVTPLVFGLSGDQPLVGDFDGDGKSDPAIFRPSNGDWWYAASSAGGAFRNVHWGQNGDIPVPADYDGDGKTDYAVYRPSEGGWYIYNSSNGSFTTTAFGISTDRPVAADYDGDGRADIAVFRPSTGIWYLLRSTAGFAGYQFGISTDTAVPGALVP